MNVLSRFPSLRLLMAVLAAIFLLWILTPLLALAATVTIPSQTVTVTVVIPSQTIPLPDSTTPPVTTPPVTTPPVTTPPAAGAFWIYHNGVFAWPGDYSFNATINYKDSVGGSPAIGVAITGPWGGWQPFAFTSGGKAFDTRPYKYLQYCTQPTQAGEVHGTGFDADNDVADGTPIQIVAGSGTTKYGPVPQVGVWGCYKIPLADFHFGNPLILKFSVTDGTGNVPNKFYVREVAFSP